VFDEIPTPVNQDNADYLRVIPAGETREIVAVGEFIYLKAADFAVDVVINEKTTRMEPGDFRRLGSKFRGINVKNPDPLRPVSVEVVVGFGEFDRKIVSGDIKSEPVLRTVDGVKPDSRSTIRFLVQPGNLATQALTNGDIIKEADSGLSDIAGSDIVFLGETNLIAYQDAFSGDVQLFNSELELVTTATRIANPEGNPANDFAYIQPLGGYVGLGGTFIGIKNKLYDDQGNEIIDLNPLGVGTLRRVAYLPGVELLAFSDSDDNRIIFTNLAGTEIIAEVAQGVGAGDPLRYDPIENKLYSWGDSGSLKIIDPVDFSVIDHTISYPLASGTSSAYWAVLQKRVIGFSVDDKSNLRKVAGTDFNTKPSFEVYPSTLEALKKPVKIETTANISVIENTDGVEIKGETIKALLEHYFLKVIDDKYLDSIYLFEPGRGARGDFRGAVSSGARSFELQGIADNLTVFAPTEVAITFDSDLPKGANLV